jgi:aminoglycoside phosphotransferase (APT) family kinase protein
LPVSTAEVVQRFLAAVEPGRESVVTEVRPISGGYSRDTAIACVSWDDGSTERFVLRGDPPAGSGVFVSDRDQEWSLLRSLSAGGAGCVQVPAARWYDHDGSYFGTKCIVSEFYGGRSLQDIGRESADLAATQSMFVSAVAAIHRTPLDVLPDELRCGQDWDDSLDGVIEILARLGRVLSDRSPALRYVAARLSAFRPAPVPLTLVHGDLQPSNILVGDRGALVIDWEFARHGDPREDLGYYLQIPLAPNLYWSDPESFLAQYREHTGLSVEQLNPQVVEYFMMLGTARLMAQMLHSLEALANGESRGVMATYLINALSLLYKKFFDICRRMDSEG